MKLEDLWVPADFPCQTELRPNGMRVPLGVLDSAGFRCQICGQVFVPVGTSYYHPNTPALRARLA